LGLPDTNGRTIVISDPHGHPEIMQRALDHAEYRCGRDRLIVAGDLVDAGRGGFACIELAERSSAEVLIGNHEHVFFWGDTLDEGRADPKLQKLVHKRIVAGEFKLAAVADGVVISHAGFSADWREAFENELGSDPEALADEANRRLAAWAGVAHRQHYEQTATLLFGQDGPLWFRPIDASDLLPGVAQVTGHTPPELYRTRKPTQEFRAAGFYQIDPFARGWAWRGCPDPPPLRYAIIEKGQVTVVSRDVVDIG
jgi:hypothetical protein